MLEPYQSEEYKKYFKSNPDVINKLIPIFGDFNNLLNDFWHIKDYIRLQKKDEQVIGIQFISNILDDDELVNYPLFIHLKKTHFEGFPLLQGLKLTGNKRVTKVDEDVFENNKELLELTIYEFSLSKYPAGFFYSLPKLKFIHIAHRLDYFDFKQLKRNHDLTELRLNVLELDNIEFFNELKNLKILLIRTKNSSTVFNLLKLKSESLMKLAIYFIPAMSHEHEYEFPSVAIQPELSKNLPQLCSLSFQNLRIEKLPKTILDLPLVSFSSTCIGDSDYKNFHSTNYNMEDKLIMSIGKTDEKELFEVQNSLKKDLEKRFF